MNSYGDKFKMIYSLEWGAWLSAAQQKFYCLNTSHTRC